MLGRPRPLGFSLFLMSAGWLGGQGMKGRVMEGNALLMGTSPTEWYGGKPAHSLGMAMVVGIWGISVGVGENRAKHHTRSPTGTVTL